MESISEWLEGLKCLVREKTSSLNITQILAIAPVVPSVHILASLRIPIHGSGGTHRIKVIFTTSQLRNIGKILNNILKHKQYFKT